MDTEIIDKLFLELSQFTKAKTKRELELEAELQREEQAHTMSVYDLNIRIAGLELELRLTREAYADTADMQADNAKKLLEGIENHHNKKLEIKRFFANISENHPRAGILFLILQAQQIPDAVDEELYGLLKEKGE